MNWTEGNLSRHSRGRQRNELVTRQKQHFAKVRNGLLKGGIKQSPISISFFGTHHPRDLTHRDNSGDATYRQPSSPLLVAKRKRTRDLQGDSEHQSSIREKRKKLLDKADWVGLELQQPIDITFPGQLQTSTGSRWARVDRPRARGMQKRREPASTPRLEVNKDDHRDRPLTIQIGSQEINPSESGASQANVKRYSLAPQPLAKTSQGRLNPISSPEPGHARHQYVPSTSSQFSQIPQSISYRIAGDRSDAHPQVSTGLFVPEEPTHVVYSSSIIHEPIPSRKNKFRVLEWYPSSSEDQGSMQVEIERPLRPIALSQEADHERWKRFVPSSSDNLHSDVSTIPPNASLSTSSRTSFLPSHLQRRLPSYDVSSEPGLSLNSQWSEPSADYQKETPAAIHDGTNNLPIQEPSHHQNEVQTTDDNSAWMKFVFDGDSDELEAAAFAEAAQQAAMDILPSEMSAASVNQTETAASCGTDYRGSNKEMEDKSLLRETSSESHMATHSTIATESASSNVATAGSTSVAESESRFRFAQPRTFVGKLADIGVKVSLPANHGGKSRGRRKRRAADGRTDIRRLPDFDGDPIEEFEEA
ncbi:hypothetical protein F5Y06DRAFT_288380 [Hypoxylon sp. FL0890]|nr:hypothetical protein F5Y06DRAFT_288380 [Hypoxylon sp. FL0890]